MLAGVLQYIKQADRLRCCALVSSRWRLAANSTIRSVNLTGDTQQGVDSLSAWLHSNRNASQIQHIQVACTSTAHRDKDTLLNLQVPVSALKQLESLQVLQCQVRTVDPAAFIDDSHTSASTAAAESSASMAATTAQLTCLKALTALSRLELDKASLSPFELSSCTGLQHLMLRNVTNIGGGPVMQLGSALPQLTQLTYLGFWHNVNKPHREQRELTSSLLAKFSNLQQLQELQLGASYKLYKAADLAHIPTSLSSLHLYDAPAMSGDSMPQLQDMTQLQCLCLVRPKSIDPAMLSGLNQLTQLALTDAVISDAAVTAQLLASLQQLTQLKHLGLANAVDAWCSAPELYAGITASSQLVSLDLSKCGLHYNAYKHILRADAFMTALTSLATSAPLFNKPEGFQRLLDCCPALQQLTIAGTGGVEYQHPDVSYHETSPRIKLVVSFLHGLLKVALRVNKHSCSHINHMASSSTCSPACRLSVCFCNVLTCSMLTLTSVHLLQLLCTWETACCCQPPCSITTHCHLMRLQGISALQYLTTITSLILNGPQVDDEALYAISRCSQLKELKLDIPDLAFEQPSLWGLQGLTRLTGLTGLHVSARLYDNLIPWFEEKLVGLLGDALGQQSTLQQ